MESVKDVSGATKASVDDVDVAVTVRLVVAQAGEIGSTLCAVAPPAGDENDPALVPSQSTSTVVAAVVQYGSLPT